MNWCDRFVSDPLWFGQLINIHRSENSFSMTTIPCRAVPFLIVFDNSWISKLMSLFYNMCMCILPNYILILNYRVTRLFFMFSMILNSNNLIMTAFSYTWDLTRCSTPLRTGSLAWLRWLWKNHLTRILCFHRKENVFPWKR